MDGQTTLSKREAVIACLQADRRLLDNTTPASAVAEAVKKKHRLEISENYASTIRKEFRENMDTPTTTTARSAVEPGNGQKKEAPTGPAPAPALLQPPREEEQNHKQPEPPSVVVIDFKAMDATVDLMGDLRKLAERCGGMDNVIVLAQKMTVLGIK